MNAYTAVAKLRSSLLAIERGDIAAELRALERAERRLDHPQRKPRASRRKPARFRLISVIDEVMLIPHFASAPMSAETVREIQARAPRKVEREAILKAIQRRRTNAAAPRMSNDAAIQLVMCPL